LNTKAKVATNLKKQGSATLAKTGKPSANISYGILINVKEKKSWLLTNAKIKNIQFSETPTFSLVKNNSIFLRK
jgi:hypothetical protein